MFLARNSVQSFETNLRVFFIIKTSVTISEQVKKYNDITMKTIKKFVVKNTFANYLPELTDFEIVEEEIPGLKPEEFLVKAEYISVDPYMRSIARAAPYDQFGFQVGSIIESKNKNYPVGMYVVSHSGWRNFAVLNEEPDPMFGIKPYQPNPQIGNMPLSLAIGALGMPGVTAFLGLLEVCRPEPGDVVCVTAAAGAVGSLVGQIARLKGCTVVGLAGADHKLNVLTNELGFDHAYNYKTEPDIRERLKAVAPDGIDCFFDNVGGALGNAVMECMAEGGRVALCGAISTYGVKKPPSRRRVPIPRLTVKSFSFTQWEWPLQLDAIRQLEEWLEKGLIVAKETTTHGFENLPAALIGMLNGENVGKAIVKV